MAYAGFVIHNETLDITPIVDLSQIEIGDEFFYEVEAESMSNGSVIFGSDVYDFNDNRQVTHLNIIDNNNQLHELSFVGTELEQIQEYEITNTIWSSVIALAACSDCGQFEFNGDFPTKSGEYANVKFDLAFRDSGFILSNIEVVK
jgi:hypothetical protein